jgi:hypothetical protein
MDLSGKTVLVTGCNSGLGSETRRVLGIIWGLRQLQLTGRTYARQEIYGLDFIRTMSCIGEWRRMTLLKARIREVRAKGGLQFPQGQVEDLEFCGR